MAARQLRTALQYMCGTLRPNGEGALSDAHLLERWVMQRDEVAFELLLRRHGPMVFALCRRLLGRTQDAEDAFQATFLVLVRKAASIQKHTALGSWLYKVAYRVALRARHKVALPVAAVEPDRLARESPAETELLWRDLRPVLDEEVHRLPQRYRDVFVLCHLQGKTNEEAASELGCPLGTVLSRLSRAREHLRGQLTRRGITIGTTSLTTLLAQEAVSAPLPPLLASLALKHALLTTGAGMTAAQQIPTTISTLSQGVLKAMFLTKIKIALSILLLISLTGLTGSYVAFQLNAQESTDGKSLKTRETAKTENPDGGWGMESLVTLKGPESPIYALAISPDGYTLVWGDGEGTVRLCENAREMKKYEGHAKAVTTVAFSPDGKYLASAGLDGIILLRDTASGKLMCEIKQKQPVFGVAFSPDGKFLASGGITNKVHLWAVPTGQKADVLQGLDSGTRSLLFSIDSKLLATGSGDGVVRMWDLSDKTNPLTYQSKVNAQVITFTPNGKVLVTGSQDGSIHLYNLVTGQEIRVLKAHTQEIKSLAVSPDSKILASASKDGTIRLWDLTTGKSLTQGKHGAPVLVLALAPGGKQLISGGKDGVVKIWDLTTGKQLSDKNQHLRDLLILKGSDRLSQLAKELIARKKTDEECIEALCLATLGRFPTQTEVKFAASHLAKSKNRHEALEDIIHNLTSTKEFTNHVQELQQRGPTTWKALKEQMFLARIKDVELLLKSPLAISPKGVDFGTIKVGQTISQKVKIEGQQPFRILDIKSEGTGNALKAEWQEGKSSKVHVVTITYDATGAGAFKGQILLVTDHGKNQTITIPVAGTVTADSPSP